MLISALAQWALLKESKRDQPEDGQVRAEGLTAAATAKKARDDDWCGNFTEILSPRPTQLQRQKFHFQSTLKMLISALGKWALLKETKRDQLEDGQARAERLTEAAMAEEARDDDWCGNFHRKKNCHQDPRNFDSRSPTSS